MGVVGQHAPEVHGEELSIGVPAPARQAAERVVERALDQGSAQNAASPHRCRAGDCRGGQPALGIRLSDGERETVAARVSPRALIDSEAPPQLVDSRPGVNQAQAQRDLIGIAW